MNKGVFSVLLSLAFHLALLVVVTTMVDFMQPLGSKKMRRQSFGVVFSSGAKASAKPLARVAVMKTKAPAQAVASPLAPRKTPRKSPRNAPRKIRRDKFAGASAGADAGATANANTNANTADTSATGNAAAGVTVRSTPVVMNEAQVEVPYPERARHLKVEGEVKLRLGVAASGRVTKIKILSGPAFGLREAARKVAKKLNFLPATNELGEAIMAWVEHRVVFRLTFSDKTTTRTKS